MKKCPYCNNELKNLTNLFYVCHKSNHDFISGSVDQLIFNINNIEYKFIESNTPFNMSDKYPNEFVVNDLKILANKTNEEILYILNKLQVFQ